MPCSLVMFGENTKNRHVVCSTLSWHVCCLQPIHYLKHLWYLQQNHSGRDVGKSKAATAVNVVACMYVFQIWLNVKIIDARKYKHKYTQSHCCGNTFSVPTETTTNMYLKTEICFQDIELSHNFQSCQPAAFIQLLPFHSQAAQISFWHFYFFQINTILLIYDSKI